MDSAHLNGTTSLVTMATTNSQRQRKEQTVSHWTESIKKPGGHRTDVAIWFRHRNENQYYVDSGGRIHGPMDQQHTVHLESVQKSSTELPDSTVTLVAAEQSRGTLLDNNEQLHKSTTIISTDTGPQRDKAAHRHAYSQELDHILHELQSTSEQRYQAYHHSSSAESSQRRHEVINNQAPTQSVQIVVPVNAVQETTAAATNSYALREQHLLEELHQTRRELDELRQTNSVITSPPSARLLQPRAAPFPESSATQERHWSSSTRCNFTYLDDSDGRPTRAASHSNVQAASSLVGRQFAGSDMAVNDAGRAHQNFPSGYSAHREQMRQMQQQNQYGQRQYRMQQRQQVMQRVEQPVEGFEEIETITLQPIGRGVHDLDPPVVSPGGAASVITARSVRSATPGSGGHHQQHHQTQEQHFHQQHYTLSSHGRAGITSGIPTPPPPLHSGGQIDGGGTFRRQQSNYEINHDNMLHQGLTSQTIQSRSLEHQLSTSSGRTGVSVTPGFRTSEQHASFQQQMLPLTITAMEHQQRQLDAILRSVQECTELWYMPHITRDDAILMLRNRPPGSFVVRDSTTYSDAFGLAVKVATLPPKVTPKSEDLESELVRHYLIETVPPKGVRLKGFNNEPVFPTLADLIQEHMQNALALPCRLTLPTGNRFASSGYESVQMSPLQAGPESSPKKPECTFTVLYLGSVEVESLTGMQAVGTAADQLLMADPASLRTTECQISVVLGEGVILTDLQRRQFFRRVLSPGSISYCGLDPKSRLFNNNDTKRGGFLQGARIFGLIAKKPGSHGENVCYLVSELESTQPAGTIISQLSRHTP